MGLGLLAGGFVGVHFSSRYGIAPAALGLVFAGAGAASIDAARAFKALEGRNRSLSAALADFVKNPEIAKAISAKYGIQVSQETVSTGKGNVSRVKIEDETFERD